MGETFTFGSESVWPPRFKLEGEFGCGASKIVSGGMESNDIVAGTVCDESMGMKSSRYRVANNSSAHWTQSGRESIKTK